MKFSTAIYEYKDNILGLLRTIPTGYSLGNKYQLFQDYLGGMIQEWEVLKAKIESDVSAVNKNDSLEKENQKLKEENNNLKKKIKALEKGI